MLHGHAVSLFPNTLAIEPKKLALKKPKFGGLTAGGTKSQITYSPPLGRFQPAAMFRKRCISSGLVIHSFTNRHELRYDAGYEWCSWASTLVLLSPWHDSVYSQNEVPVSTSTSDSDLAEAHLILTPSAGICGSCPPVLWEVDVFHHNGCNCRPPQQLGLRCKE